ncbi:conserved hypothetical protein (plasmid) [Rhodococcus jostii RHA1]|uniref:Uncharacterized protein n=1 Tax=Rhodococcus jostii (strain RHA1) TaxID=101510 RepID=Q0RVU6_RHOJR|nr:5-oxoprolinase subunit PxpA [Rhodococcus jostii]ABH00590.1 conserved hypothetical protein [Rhodococcus jostii RHA1]
MRIDLNADAGESFGRWVLGHDEELLKHVTSVNTACGFHGGDPGWMRNSVRLAKENDVDLGAHPGFPDLGGFGRRTLAASHEEVVDMCVYQVGALMAFAKMAGVRMTHVKPHGSLNVMINQDHELLVKFAEAMVELHEGLDIVTFTGAPANVLRDRGFRVRAEIVADMEYDDDGNVIIERLPPRKEPQYVAARGVEMAQGILTTIGGEKLDIEADTLCIHGDRPNAVDIGAALRRALTDADIEVVALSRRSVQST